jgi:hypothetical protein
MSSVIELELLDDSSSEEQEIIRVIPMQETNVMYKIFFI